jgi:hypothetical protein
MEKKDIMQVERVLPADFDGTFRFTNWTDEAFVGVWGGKQYHYPAKTTSPIVMTDQTPLEIQQIRKKFAKDLAEREFFKGQAYNRLHAQERNNDGSPRLNSIQQAGTYSLEDLSPFIQRCLEPLTVASAKVTQAPKESIESKLSRNESGELNTEVIDKKTSLRKKALEA